ncbi:MAG: hypothetical protein WC752_01160 [Patescibacteria group bacterium]|jgi:hypothetical protein
MRKNVVNVTPHLIRFLSVEGEVYEVPPSGTVLNARFEDEPAGMHPTGVELVRTKIVPDVASTEALERLEKENPEALIVGSLIAAQAWPGRVMAMIAAPGFERRPSAEKRMRDDKFTVFAAQPPVTHEEIAAIVFQAAQEVSSAVCLYGDWAVIMQGENEDGSKEIRLCISPQDQRVLYRWK